MGVVDPQDVDVVLATERLDKREVDLKRHILHVLVVRSQHAQNHVIRVAGGRRSTLIISINIYSVVFVSFSDSRLIRTLCGSVVTDTYTFNDFAASYTPTVMQPCGNAELRTSSKAFATESILKQKNDGSYTNSSMANNRHLASSMSGLAFDD